MIAPLPGVTREGESAPPVRARKDADGYFWIMGRIDDVKRQAIAAFAALRAGNARRLL